MNWAAIGLAMDIVGVLLLWRFGLPPNVSRGGTSYLILEQSDEAEARKAKVYDHVAHVAITLIVLGFILQLIATL